MMEGPAPGTILLGRYRVERELGSGGMGVVLEATHISLGQTVAIKLLNPVLAREPEVVARFLREARIAANLPSDHIARASDVGQTETGAPYLVMERLYGRDLEGELSRRGRLPVTEAVDLTLEACEGVAEAHAHGLVHRDLKPANLFLAERPNRPRTLKVLDFGLSKEDSSSASLTGTEAVFGTPQYMSPEQIQSAKNVDARSDQHALGMILYEMLAGEPAFKAESVTQLIVVIATQPPPRVRVLRPDVPLALEEAIVHALGKRPSDRFRDLAAFAKAIAPFGGPEARSRAELVGRALANTRPPMSSGVDDAPSRVSRTPTDQAPTMPYGLPRAPAQTNAGLTSSVNGFDKGRLSRKYLAIGAVAAALVIGVVVALSLGSSGETPATATATETPPSAAAPAARPINTTETTQAASTPATTASSAASADASKSKTPQPAQGTTKKTNKATDTVKKAVETFGKR